MVAFHANRPASGPALFRSIPQLCALDNRFAHNMFELGIEEMNMLAKES